MSLVAHIGFVAVSAYGDAPQGLSFPAQPHFTDIAQIALGKALFFDKRLSADGSISCASCHIPERAFSDGRPVAVGIQGRLGTRNTPSLWNVASATALFWDGRRATLESQATDPLLNPAEHGLLDDLAVVNLLRTDSQYRQWVSTGFSIAPEVATIEHFTRAIATFERTLLAGDSAFDRYYYANDSTALSPAAQRGLALFRGQAQCANCHRISATRATFTDYSYHRLGVGHEQLGPNLASATLEVAGADPHALDRLIIATPQFAELGRFLVTRNPLDIGKFKTPSLRNVALTAPYMHNGSVATLEQAIDAEIYYRGIELQRPLILTPREKLDLLAFLNSLTSPCCSSINRVSPENQRESLDRIDRTVAK